VKPKAIAKARPQAKSVIGDLDLPPWAERLLREEEAENGPLPDKAMIHEVLGTDGHVERVVVLATRNGTDGFFLELWPHGRPR
jgi:hypothetical protein